MWSKQGHKLEKRSWHNFVPKGDADHLYLFYLIIMGGKWISSVSFFGEIYVDAYPVGVPLDSICTYPSCFTVMAQRYCKSCVTNATRHLYGLAKKGSETLRGKMDGMTWRMLLWQDCNVKVEDRAREREGGRGEGINREREVREAERDGWMHCTWSRVMQYNGKIEMLSWGTLYHISARGKIFQKFIRA